MTDALATSLPRPRVAARLTLVGRVQGIGMRPAVARFARQLSLTGYVGNSRSGVEIHIEGPAQCVARFQRELPAHLPAAAEISTSESVCVEPAGYDCFLIQELSDEPNEGPEQGRRTAARILSAALPPDVVVCSECLAEVQSAADRRHDYPFTSCADCGPRVSIVQRMPYERSQTGMAAFALCEHCRGEYESFADRRFHAQTIACPRCGPQIWLRDAKNRVIARGNSAAGAAAAAILAGRIVAMRGLGGYQLLVDATSQSAVERLRERKRRYGKPLAVVAASLDEAAKLARLDEAERRLLCSPAGPIVVAAVRGDAPLASSVTAELNTVGVMLPTTPLHWLLVDATRRPLVCTSANVEGDPLVYTADAAFKQLRGIADVWLEHDRPICRPIDDSVVRVIAGQPVTIRLARGYAPMTLDLETDEPLIGLGGHQKASLALSNGAQAVLGPHIGDLHGIAARQRYAEHLDDWSALYGIDRGRLVGDLHPDYFTTHWAESQARSFVSVQHHHAHIAAGMTARGWLDREVLGVALDGAGYGVDGTIWGGEFLRVTAGGFERVGHLRPMPLAGGERAVRQPWRVATALVREAAGDETAAGLVFRSGDALSLLPVLQRPNLSPVTTSAGRLFDGAAALILGIEQCHVEGQAAMLLEAACDASAAGRYEIPLRDTHPKQLDWRPLIRHLLRDRAAGHSPGLMAMRFHRGLADAITDVCRCYSPMPVVLGGGVFQNRVLVELLARRFAQSDQPLGLPGRIPTGDGGLAAGQLAAVAARHRRSLVPGRGKSSV